MQGIRISPTVNREINFISRLGISFELYYKCFVQKAVVCEPGDGKYFVFAMHMLKGIQLASSLVWMITYLNVHLISTFKASGVLKVTLQVAKIVDHIIEICISFGFVNARRNNVHALHTYTYSSVLQFCAHYFGFPEAVQIAYGDGWELECPFTNS